MYEVHLRCGVILWRACTCTLPQSHMHTMCDPNEFSALAYSQLHALTASIMSTHICIPIVTSVMHLQYYETSAAGICTRFGHPAIGSLKVAYLPAPPDDRSDMQGHQLDSHMHCNDIMQPQVHTLITRVAC